MLANPEVLNAILNNPSIKPMLDANPMLKNMMSNPQFLQNMMNPTVLQSLSGMQNMFGGLNTNPTSTTNTTFNNNSTGQNQFNPFVNPLLMNPLLNINTTTQTTVDPKEKYKEQNEKLKEMGFYEEEANYRALEKTRGNVDAAVERLLNNL
jgi:ubiquilin